MPEERRIDGVAEMLPGKLIVVKREIPDPSKRNAVKSTRPLPAHRRVPTRRDHALKAGLVSKLFLDPVAISATEPRE